MHPHPSTDTLHTAETEPPILRKRELALRSGPVLDLPPRTTRLVLGAGLTALVVIIVQSLVGDRPETVAVDKLLHFGGYAGLAMLFMLAFRLRRALPALVILAGVSYLIELVQPLNLRSRDLGDAVANTLGIALGAALGIVIRLVYGYLRTELSAARIRRKLVTFPPGATILRAGDLIDRFYMIKQGAVILYTDGDPPQELDRLDVGSMFGLLAEIERTPQPVTVVAATEVVVYQVDYDELIDAVGGPEQPIGVIVQYMARELRQASERVAELQHQLNTS
jgi:VanZ family protein